MKKCKSGIIGVVFIIILLACVAIIPQIYAEEATTTVTQEELSCEDLATKYGLFIETTDEPDQYKIIKDPVTSCGGKVHSDASFKIISVNGVVDTNGATLTKTNNEATVKARLMHATDDTYYISIVVQNVENPNETIDIKYTVEQEGAGRGSAGKTNTNYYGLCATFRQTAIAQNGVSFFETALPYCYQTTVSVNYTETELQKKIDSIVSLWTAYQNQNNTGTADFNAIFNDIKTKAHKYPTTNVVLDPLNTTLTLKCAYDKVKTGADTPVTYTNEYGDSISSIDYYLNKDYYYSSATTVDGEVKYVYNFAPGHTITDTQQACERTCEEAVKVEYGPPIASKAGLCFEYKVKVTSYVKCTAKVIANPPEQFTGYCNPSPICRYSGGVRNLEQAGPKEDYERCIKSCDGGKYTEKCSLKCYKEVYGSINTKLAINYETAKAEKLAMSTDTTLYSVADCMKDNEGYFGCYAYEGDTILWRSHLNYDLEGTFQQTTWNRRYALGRWYIDRVYKQADGTYLDEWNGNANYVRNNGGYNILGIYESCKDNTGAHCGRYVSDQDGIYRRNYGSTLCDDNCNWRTDVCLKTADSVQGNEYLNPGTIEKDALANQEAYEDAVRSCIGTATCSEHTAEFTISLTYDTTTNEVKKQNTVTFPFDTKKDTLIANKTNNITDRSRSSILDFDGCYKNKDVGNHYMTEWSFPGTYIHNKTGEISFQRPDVTDGWYYDDKKFCMPLDADSVNVKWWEWYKLGNTCYTRSDIESELAGKSGTSNGYNIKATAKKFGYFGWNFDINCFYGLRNEICNVQENGCCGASSKESNGVSNYTFRSVAINNLFPNAVEEGVVDPDKREIGFNWTSKALSIKNDKYVVDPAALIDHIESGAATLYSDDANNLDYKFYLTPATLAKIKSYNNNNDYASWDGTVELVNGIKVYQSNLFRNVGSHTKVLTEVPNSVIKLGKPGVNNENYRASVE